MARALVNKNPILSILPISVIEIADKPFSNIEVNTPHKGIVTIHLKQTHYPFLFGSVTQTDKSSQEVIFEIRKLEEESCEYLINEWKKTL